MGPDIVIEKIECTGDQYCIDLRNTDTTEGFCSFIRKDALLALITVAEKESIERGDYAK